MRLLRFFSDIFNAYDFYDKFFSGLAVFLILLMFLKMILFPSGLFGFGSPNIYTEGLVSSVGVQNLNPLFVDFNEVDRDISALIFSGLMKYDPKKKAVVDDLARLTISEDKKEYVFSLKKGVKWHDGANFSADDVIFTFKTVISDPAFQNEILRTNFDGVQIKKIDDAKVSFRLEQPNTFFVANFTVGILPKHLLRNVPVDSLIKDSFNKQPIGTGPYKIIGGVKSFSSGRMQVSLERSENYYGEIPQIQTLRFNVYKSSESLLKDLPAVNGLPRLSAENLPLIKESARFVFQPYFLPRYTALFLNMDAEIIKKDRLIRLALLKALDKEKYFGKMQDRKIVDNLLLENKQTDPIFRYDQAQANGALKEAGYLYAPTDKEKRGVRYNKEEKSLEVNLIARLPVENSPQYDEILSLIDFLRDSWSKVGFSVKIELLEDQEFRARVVARQYDVLLVGQSLGYNSDMYSYWHSSQADPRGQNFANYKSFRADSLIEDLRSTFDQARIVDKISQLSKILAADLPVIFLYQPVHFYASDQKITGLNLENLVFPSDRFASVYAWRFQEK